MNSVAETTRAETGIDLKWRRVALIVAAVIGIQAAIYMVMYWRIDGATERGQFGDAFGVVNALFSGLGFAGLVIALVLQQKQMTLQRDEAIDLRREAAAVLASQATSNSLAALTFLLGHYEHGIRQATGQSADGPSGASSARSRTNIREKQRELEAILVRLHVDVVQTLGAVNVR